MNDLVLTSLVLITYEQKEYIFEALNSVFEQTYPKIELIVSDDGSKNFFVEEIIDYIEKKKSKSIVSYKVNKNLYNLGTVKNLNKAIGMSNGEYIFVLAGDDVLYDKNVVRDYVDFACKNNAMVVSGIAMNYSSDLKHFLSTNPSNVLFEKIVRMEPLDLYLLCAQGINVLTGCAAVYSRRTLQENGYFDEEYFLLEDVTFASRFLRNGNRIHFYNRPYVKHRYGGVTAITSKKNKLLRNDLCLMYKKEFLPYRDILGERLARKVEFDLGVSEAQSFKERLRIFFTYREFVLGYFSLQVKIIITHYLQKIGLYYLLSLLVKLRRKIIKISLIRRG